MSTTTPAGIRAHDPDAVPVATGAILDVAVDDIERFPLNPRDELEFDEASLRELGETMRRRQVQPAIVRRRPQGPIPDAPPWQLIIGERRWRAAMLVGLPTLRVEVVDVGDAEAVRMCGEENEQRKEWSAIARARWYRELKRFEKLTDDQLGERIGLSQAHVTQTLGLLELPEAWQQRIITGVISPTVARPLIPWAKKRPQVLDEIEKKLPEPVSVLTVVKMEELVCKALKKLTRPMEYAPYAAVDGPKFQVTRNRREELDCESLKVDTWDGPRLRAWNVRAWDEFQQAAIDKDAADKADEIIARRGVGGPSEATGSADRGEDSERDPPAKPAEPAINIQNVELHVYAWMAEVCMERLKTADKATRLRFVALVACVDDSASFAPAFVDGRGDCWPSLAKLDERKLLDKLLAAAIAAVKAEPSNSWERPLYARIGNEWAQIGAALKLNFAAEFRPTRELLREWPESELRKFPRTARKGIDDVDVVDALMRNWKPGFVPKEVKPLFSKRKRGGA